MSKTPAIAIFDAGKTNKKFFLFNKQYEIILEQSIEIPEVLDDDGFPCEDIHALTGWVNGWMDRMFEIPKLEINAVNFSAYGASFVHLDQDGRTIAPLYNYLKPFPSQLELNFYEKYGGKSNFSVQTASPVLGNLNSGLQIYRIKYEQPGLFEKIKSSLHLPQYLSRLSTHESCSDITSIGCHTGLWDFSLNRYHDWVFKENIDHLLPTIFPSDGAFSCLWMKRAFLAGSGLHDSSAALIPYFFHEPEPFILLSTGTWCISMNPFNHTPITSEELSKDCLCYLDFKGRPVKASRLFIGNDHLLQVKRLAKHFNKPIDYYHSVEFDSAIISNLSSGEWSSPRLKAMDIHAESQFAKRDLDAFQDYAWAYHQLMLDLIGQQAISLRLVMEGASVDRIYVDGGFSRNTLFMQLLASAFPEIRIFASSMSQGSALGAALAIHSHWNNEVIPPSLIKWKSYSK
jgi:L-fuculokinase